MPRRPNGPSKIANNAVVMSTSGNSPGRFHLTLATEPGSPRLVKLGAREPAEQPPLQVGDLAKLTGKTVRAIHHYEELGLIEPMGRSKGHYRLFDPETPVRIRWISKLQSLGLSLGEIRTLVKNRHASPSAQQSANQLRVMYEEKLSDVRSRLKELSALEQELEASLAYLDSCGTSCTPELVPTDCAQCDRHPEGQEPDLISGALA